MEVMEQRLGLKDLKNMIAWEGTNNPLTCGYPPLTGSIMS